MAAATVRTVLNRVLTAIGETELDSLATSVTGTLPLRLLEFLNQFKEEIEEAHLWRALRQNPTITVTAGTNNATITNGDERARIICVPSPIAGQYVPLVFDITDTTNPIPLTFIPLNELLYRQQADSVGTTTQLPSYYSTDNQSGVAKLYIYPTPNNDRSIILNFYQPQAALGDTDIDTVILIPTPPLVKGLIWYALTDRGEEMGANSMFTEERYRTSMDDAIGRDSGEGGANDQLVVV